MSDGAPWRAALAGRLSYVAHWMARHTVVWRAMSDGAAVCPGDIVCCTCAQVLWRRAHDPRRPGTFDRAQPPDHWGGTRVGGAAKHRRAVDTTRHTPGEHQDALMDALTRALRLAEGLPPGKPEDDVRRSFCEFIEAMEAGAARDVRIGRVLRSITRLQKAQAKRDRRLEQVDSADTERFASIVRSEVLPLLAESGF